MLVYRCFQFLGIPPKGERPAWAGPPTVSFVFPISRDPPEGGTLMVASITGAINGRFPISRDPPEGGTD